MRTIRSTVASMSNTPDPTPTRNYPLPRPPPPAPPLPPPAQTTPPPTPPAHLFRIIRTLHTDEHSATYLCLPRKLRSTETLTSHNGSIHPSGRHPTHNLARNLKKAPSARLKHQIDFEHAVQLLIVKTHAAPDGLRGEGTLMEALHKALGEEAGPSQSFLGSYVLKAQYTDAVDSWLVLRPLFGRSLFDICGYAGSQPDSVVKDVKPIPSFFIWHIFLSLMEGLTLIHGLGVTNNNVCLENVVLNPYPVDRSNWFRDWPDVVLSEFGVADELDERAENAEVRALLSLMVRIVEHYSDVAVLRTAGVDMRNSPLATFSDEASQILDLGVSMNMVDVAHRWKDLATAGREKGHQMFPDEMMRLATNEMVDAEELARVRAVVCRFPTKAENFGVIARKYDERWSMVYQTDVKIEGRRERARGLCIIKFSREKAFLLRDMRQAKKYLDGRYVDQGEPMEVDGGHG
ncbi:hypothetical protein CC80DRAFT_263238 [Byssothecium circinans]|uniref:Protein kinase domain-containing protein n=1 Tax=Byssothecium circinans TaxID=147558 RepID=A0A6A5U731_9PLEO|nr:hypothetical protein CC80DRAFT_263238 [Byssothecium circinans]